MNITLTRCRHCLGRQRKCGTSWLAWRRTALTTVASVRQDNNYGGRTKKNPLCKKSMTPDYMLWSFFKKNLKMKVQTWTTPLRYILMSIWFFCHLGLDDGSTNLTKKEAQTNKLPRCRQTGATSTWSFSTFFGLYPSSGWEASEGPHQSLWYRAGPERWTLQTEKEQMDLCILKSLKWRILFKFSKSF